MSEARNFIFYNLLNSNDKYLYLYEFNNEAGFNFWRECFEEDTTYCIKICGKIKECNDNFELVEKLNKLEKEKL